MIRNSSTTVALLEKRARSSTTFVLLRFFKSVLVLRRPEFFGNAVISRASSDSHFELSCIVVLAIHGKEVSWINGEQSNERRNITVV